MKRIIFTLSLIAAAGFLYAQPLNPNNPVPLDGGLSLLLAAGATYGAGKLYQNKRRKVLKRP